MSVFTKDVKIKQAPQSAESKVGSKYLQGLLAQGTPEIPQQQIAEMTPVEQAIMGYLPKYLQNVNESTGLSADVYKDILSGGTYDEQAEQLKKEYEWSTKGGLNELRRRANLMGMLDSTNAVGQEAAYLNQSQRDLSGHLLDLQEQEQLKKLSAAQGLQSTQAQGLQNVAAVGGMSERERILEQALLDSRYQQAIMQLLFPYQEMANIGSTLLNYSPGHAVTGGGLTDTGFITATLASMFSRGGGAAAACDIRVKEHIKPIDSALEKIQNLDGKTYNYKGVNNRRHAGVIAQDVEQILPEAVENINGVKYVRFDGLIALLVNAVKELNTKVALAN